MKVYKLTLIHDIEEHDKTYFIACNKINTVVDYPKKKLEMHSIDYEVESITLMASDVVIFYD